MGGPAVCSWLQTTSLNHWVTVWCHFCSWVFRSRKHIGHSGNLGIFFTGLSNQWIRFVVAPRAWFHAASRLKQRKPPRKDTRTARRCSLARISYNGWWISRAQCKGILWLCTLIRKCVLNVSFCCDQAATESHTWELSHIGEVEVDKEGVSGGERWGCKNDTSRTGGFAEN